MDRPRILRAVAALALAAGCGGGEPGPGMPVDMPFTSPSQPAVDNNQPVASMTAGPQAPVNDDRPANEQRAPTTDPNAGDPNATPAGPMMVDDPIEMPGAPAQDPAAGCDPRRVSYAVPCHNDPNPCGIDSGFAGDEYCLLPPAEGEGFQIHIGPDDYDDPDEIAKYVMEPGEEFNNSVLGHIPVDEDVWFNRIQVQMRPGSHHWISSVVAGRPEERVYSGTDCEGMRQIGSIGGGQNLIYDNPPMGVPAPENVGLGRPLQGNSSLCMNLHAYNFGETPQLRELWINIYTVPESEVTQRGGRIGVVGGVGMSVPPGQKETITYTETFDGDGRITQIFGHRHAWTPRFAVWLNEELIYDSWNWQESVTFNYDSLSMNPPINTAGKTDGAVSGVLEFKAGDQLKFSCFIENESTNTLRFANELYGGEMCNLWGSTVGASLSGFRF